MTIRSTSLLRIVFVLALLLSCTNRIHAQFIWNGVGGDAFWSTGTNWTGTGPALGFNGSFIFGGTNQLANTSDLTGGTITDLTFDATAGAFILDGSGVTASGGTWNNSSLFTQTINLPVDLTGDLIFTGAAPMTLGGAVTNSGGDRTVTNNLTGGSLLTFSSPIFLSESAGTGRILTFSGTGNTLISGNISDMSGGGLAGSLNYTGTGSLTLSGNNDYTGDTTVSTAGTLNINSSTALGTGILRISGVATLDNTSGSALTLANSFDLNSNLVFGTSSSASDNNLTLTGTTPMVRSMTRTITLNGTGTTLAIASPWVNNTDSNRVLTVNGAGNTLQLGDIFIAPLATNRTLTVDGSGDVRITGVISNGGTSAASALASGGLGTLILTGANTYQGTTTVNPGSTILLDFGFPGATATDIIPTGRNVTVNNGTLSLAGAATGGVSSSSQTIGTLTITSRTRGSLVLTSGDADNTLSMTVGGITRTAFQAASLDITFAGAGTTNLNLPAANSVNGLLTSSGTGTAYATANGGTTWATNVAGVGGALTTYGTDFTDSTSNIDVSTGSPAAFTVNSLRFNSDAQTLTLTGLNTITTGGILVTATGTNSSITGGQIRPNGTSTSREIIIHNFANLTINSDITNNGANATVLSIVGDGNGVLTLVGASSYTGATELAAGTLNIEHVSALGTGQFRPSGGAFNNTTGAPIVLANTLAPFGNFTVFTPSSTSNNDITFNNASGDFARTITLDGTGTTLTLANGWTNSGNGSRTFTVNGVGNTLVLGGLSISTNATNRIHTIRGSADVLINGPIVNGGTTIGSGITINSTATVTFDAANTYGGPTTLTAGALVLTDVAALGGGGLVAINGGILINNTGAPLVVPNNVSIGNSFTFGGPGSTSLNDMTFSSTTPFASDIGRTINFAGTGTALTIAGAWNNNNNASNTLSVNGAGNTLVLAGGITLANGAATAARTLTFGGTGNITVSGDIVNGPAAFNHPVVINKPTSGIVIFSGNNTYPGTTTLTAGDLELNSTNAIGGGGNIIVSANGILNINASNAISGASNVTVSGGTLNAHVPMSISGAGGITVSSGVINLNAANALSGGGIVTVSGTGLLNVANGAAIGAGSPIALNGGTFLNSSGAPISLPNLVSIGGNFTFGDVASTSTADVSFTNTTPFAATLSRTITFAGTGTTLSIAAPWNNSAASDTTLTVNGPGNTLVLTGGVSIAEDATERTLTLAGSGIISINGPISNGGTATASNLSVNSSTVTVNLAGVNTYGGTTTLSTGTLNLANSAALSGGGLVALNGGVLNNITGSAQAFANPASIGGSFSFGDSASTSDNNVTFTDATPFTSSLTRTITFPGTGTTLALAAPWINNQNSNRVLTIVGSGNTLELGGITISSTATQARSLTVNGSGNLTVNGPIEDGAAFAMPLTVSGTGTVTLRDANTYTGRTTVGSAIPIRSTMVLDFAAPTAPTDNIILSGNLLTINNGLLSLVGSPGATNSQTFGSTTFGGTVLAELRVEQNGATAFNLDLGALARGTGTAVDMTLPTSGTVTTSTTESTGANNILTITSRAFATVDRTTWATNNTGTIGALPELSYGTDYTATTSDISVVTASPAAFTVNTLRFNDPSQVLTLDSSGFSIITTGSILVTPTGGGSEIASAGGSAGLRPGTAADEIMIHNYSTLTISAPILNNGTGIRVNINGTGETTLSGDSTYTGLTRLVSGTLNLNSPTAAGSGAGALQIFGGTLNNTSGAPNTVPNPIIISADFTFGTISSNSDNDLTMTGTAPFAADINRTITLEGTGTTLSFASKWNNNSNASRTLTVNGPSNTLVLAGGLRINSGNSTDRTLTITGTGNVHVSGILENGGTSTASNLIYAGSGLLTLSAENTYGGTTTINGGGTLVVTNTSGSGTGTGNVSVPDGTLGGTGSISGAVNIGAAGTLATGASIGTLTVAGNVDFSSPTSTFAVEITGGTISDLLDMSSGGQILNFTSGGVIQVSGNSLTDTYTYIIADLGSTGSVTLDGGAPPSTQLAFYTYGGTNTGPLNLDVSGLTFPDGSTLSLNIASGTSTTLVLTAVVPEPVNALALGLLGIIATGLARRNRSRSCRGISR